MWSCLARSVGAGGRHARDLSPGRCHPRSRERGPDPRGEFDITAAHRSGPSSFGDPVDGFVSGNRAHLGPAGPGGFAPYVATLGRVEQGVLALGAHHDHRRMTVKRSKTRSSQSHTLLCAPCAPPCSGETRSAGTYRSSCAEVVFSIIRTAYCTGSSISWIGPTCPVARRTLAKLDRVDGLVAGATERTPSVTGSSNKGWGPDGTSGPPRILRDTHIPPASL